MIGVPDLDAIPQPLSLLHSIDPHDMTLVHRGQTRLQLASALSTAVYAPFSHSIRPLLLASQVEVFLTLVVCATMLYKKKTLGNSWIFIRRPSRTGDFYVANAVFVLVIGVSSYIVTFGISCIFLTAAAYASFSNLECYWIYPLPWLPLVLGAYASIHGFIVACSPRSPLSNVNDGIEGKRFKWYYLPLTRSAVVSNVVLILPCTLLSISTVFLCAQSGISYYRAKHIARQILPAEILLQMHSHVANRPSTLINGDQPASDELIWLARQVAAAYLECNRYVCINMAVFAACAYALFVPCVIYGVPNIMSLVDHTCSRCSEPPPASCKSYPGRLWFLLTKGKPNSKDNASRRNLASWKMTILANMYIWILLICVPAFGFVPIYIICRCFPKDTVVVDLGSVLTKALLAVSLITIMSCTSVAIFCTVATLDPLFRAAIGLNIIRTKLPVDIKVIVGRTEYEERDLGSPTFLTAKPSMLGLHELDKMPALHTVKEPMSSVDSMSRVSPSTTSFPDHPIDPRFVIVETNNRTSGGYDENHDAELGSTSLTQFSQEP